MDSSDFESGSLTISFTPSDAGQEILSIDTSGTISFNASNNQVSHSGTVIGTLDNTNDGTAGTMEFTFNGNATPAAVSALLNAIQYVHNADNPTEGNRTLTITVTDGDNGSASESGLTVNVTAAPDQADISALGGTVVYTEGTLAIAVDDNATISDGDDVYTNSTLAVVVSGNDVSEDSLSFSLVGTPTITENGSNVECNEGSGAVTLGAITGTDTSKLVTMASSGVTQGCVQALLRSVQFTNGNSFEPADDDRTVSYTYTGPDTLQSTGSVLIDFVTDPDHPTFSNLNSGFQWDTGMPEFVESAAAIAIDADATLDDDTTNFNSATLQVTIVNAVATEDDLTVASSLHNSIASITNGGVNGTNDTTVTFTFNGSATESDIISLLQGIKYDNTNDDNPSSTEREISVVFTDVGGLPTNADSVYVKITPQNDDPVISNFSNTPTFTEDGTAFVTVDGAITVSDPDAPSSFDGGTLTISVYATTPANIIPEDQLDYNNTISIGTVTAVDNQISVALDPDSTTASVADFIEAVGYKNTNLGNPDTTTRTVKVVLTDGQGGTANASTTISIVARNDEPEFVNLGGTVSFTEAQTALAMLDGDATVSDDDEIDFNGGSLVVSISANAQNTEDNLNVDSSISVSGTDIAYNGTTFASLTQALNANNTSLTFNFNSNATTAEVNALIQSLYYQNTNNDNPDTTTRTVSFTFTDIADTTQTTAATGTVDVTITAVDDNPVLTI
ncbi:MAG: hypothetical protein VX026_07665, partial [Myxococcota bacterium]|nr:hypothetical protein [Myxococcota bacterium]